MVVRRSKRFLAILSAFILVLTFAVSANAFDFENKAEERLELIPGGMTFGVKFFTEGALVIGTTGIETSSGVLSPAKDAGLTVGDIIVNAGGKNFASADELISLVSGSGGNAIVLKFLRDGEELSTTVTPVRDIESNDFKIGILVRDSTAGIGTVTYIDPKTNDFGGLGHGIYDFETGTLLPLASGAVVDVDITNVIKSVKNSPGEIRGDFGKLARGELWCNSEVGVFGTFYELPKTLSEPLPIGFSNELKNGSAHILTTLESGAIEEYAIEIEHIYEHSGDIKNFLISITDERLIDQTGGIVQGMSGSPIIQDGRLVGAVTHVLVNDPTHGYGIFIENMLNTAVSTERQNSPLAA